MKYKENRFYYRYTVFGYITLGMSVVVTGEYMFPITIVLNSQKSLACVTAAAQSSMLNVHASAEPDQPLETVASLPQANSRLHTSAITQL